MTPTDRQPEPRTGRGLTAWRLALAFALLLGIAPHAMAQPASIEVYGFAMLDMGINLNTIDPNWFDTMRLNKLPSFEGEFGEDGVAFAGVRQSRLGVRGFTPTAMGELRTTFEFELFGTGVDEGQTTFRLRHAYGELGKVGAGQYLEPVHGPRRVPELTRVPGARRAWSSSATSRCAICRFRATRGLPWRSSALAHQAMPACWPIASSSRT